MTGGAGDVAAVGVLPSSSKTACDRVDTNQQVGKEPVSGCLPILSRKSPPFFQQRDLLHMQSKQRISPDLVRNGETWSSCARISAEHLIQHLMREIKFG